MSTVCIICKALLQIPSQDVKMPYVKSEAYLQQKLLSRPSGHFRHVEPAVHCLDCAIFCGGSATHHGSNSHLQICEEGPSGWRWCGCLL